MLRLKLHHVQTIIEAAGRGRAKDDHLQQSVQSSETMATRFFKAPLQTSIQTRAQVPSKIEAKVGSATVDESCQAHCVGKLFMYVIF